MPVGLSKQIPENAALYHKPSNNWGEANLDLEKERSKTERTLAQTVFPGPGLIRVKPSKRLPKLSLF
jgi:hypothetical protein